MMAVAPSPKSVPTSLTSSVVEKVTGVPGMGVGVYVGDMVGVFVIDVGGISVINTEGVAVVLGVGEDIGSGFPEQAGMNANTRKMERDFFMAVFVW